MIHSPNRIQSKLKNNYFEPDCFTEYQEQIKTGWLIPGGYGIHCEIYEHEHILDALGIDFTEAFYHGWVRKISNFGYEFDRDSHRARALVVLDLKRFKPEASPVYVDFHLDTNNHSYVMSLKTIRDNNFNLSKLLTRKYEVS